MNCGPHYEYLWKDSARFTRATRVSAPEYVQFLSLWVEAQLNDDRLFPTDAETPYPEGFDSTVRNIFRRLFRVFAHVYSTHLDAVVQLGVDAAFHTAFRHMMYFAWEFNLIPAAELAPARDYLYLLLGDKAVEVMGPPPNPIPGLTPAAPKVV
jgi:MOB kinase activator 1